MSGYENIIVGRVCDLMERFRTEYYDYCIFDPVDPEIKFNLKGGTVAGRCVYYLDGRGELEFNPIIMEDNWDDFDQTVIHEVAHYCVFLLYGALYKDKRRVVHGNEWKRMMKFLGGKIIRCHNYNTKRASKRCRTQRKWEYKCDCSTHLISTTLHNRMLRGQMRICVDCKTPIKYVGN
jgi:SprT protein